MLYEALFCVLAVFLDQVLLGNYQKVTFYSAEAEIQDVQKIVL